MPASCLHGRYSTRPQRTLQLLALFQQQQQQPPAAATESSSFYTISRITRTAGKLDHPYFLFLAVIQSAWKTYAATRRCRQSSLLKDGGSGFFPGPTDCLQVSLHHVISRQSHSSYIFLALALYSPLPNI